MAKVEVIKKFEFRPKGKHNYVLTPDMGIVTHLPEVVVKAALEAKAVKVISGSDAVETEKTKK